MWMDAAAVVVVVAAAVVVLVKVLDVAVVAVAAVCVHGKVGMVCGSGWRMWCCCWDE